MSDTPGLFDGVLAAGAVREQVGDVAWLRAMLDFEAALAHAQADTGLIPREHADAIAAQCRPEYYDPAELGRAAADIGNPAGPLVRALTARVPGEAARFVHFGATSQDVLDTAAMLVVARALVPLLVDLEACADRLAALAEAHAGTVQAGRTLLQQALPTTFGLTAAGWMAGLDAAVDRLAGVLVTRLAVQFGGAVGTLAALGEHGLEVLAALATRLGLTEPLLPWHTVRTRVADVATALGEVCGITGKIAGDIVLLAQTEVGELVEEGPAGAGGSSTMPHKRNPVAAVCAAASARQSPGLVATLLAAMDHELQRAAGAWHAEWRPLSELLHTTGSAVHWLRTSLERVRVDTARMRANLDAAGGLPLAERITTELVAVGVPRLAAHDAVTSCCARAEQQSRPLADVLGADPLVTAHLDAERIKALLDPDQYLGSARGFTERALAAHRERREAP